MTLRATRQYAEVLAPGAGALRATRQYTEVLASGDGDLRITRQYIEILTKVPVPGETDNELGIIDEVLEMVHYNDWWPTEDVITFQQGVRAYPFEWGESVIAFSQVASGYTPFYRDLKHILVFTDSARSRNHYHTIEDVITFTQTAPKYHERSVSNIIYFTHRADRLRYSVINTITFNQSITTGRTKGIPVQELGLKSEVVFSGDWIRAITQVLGIGHSLTYYFDTGCARKSYTPFTGESTINIVSPPSSVLPFVQDSAKQFRLEYPALGGVQDTVLLRAPELDNVDQNVSSRINRETRGGNLVIFADPTWPKVNTIKVSFIGLSEAEATALQSFIINHLGKDVLLTDWEGHEWIGIIISPEDVIVQNGKENWSASFSFEGVVIDFCTPDTGLVLTDSFTFICNRLRLLDDIIVFTDAVVFGGDWDRPLADILVFDQEAIGTV